MKSAPILRIIHVKNYHSKEIKNVIVCHCGKRFIDRSTLNSHTKNTHEKHKNHICKICNRVFTYTYNLEVFDCTLKGLKIL